MVSVRRAHSKPVHSFSVIQTKIPKYTKKYWKVRVITHCTVGEIGGVYCTPRGCAIVKMLTITAVKPR